MVSFSLSGRWWSVLFRPCSWGCLLQIRTTPLTGWLATMRIMRMSRSLTVPESTARQKLLYPPVPLRTWARLTAAAAGAATWRRATVTGAGSGRSPAGDLPAAWKNGTETPPLDCVKHSKEKEWMATTLSRHWRDPAALQRTNAKNGSSLPTCQRKREFLAARWAPLWFMCAFHRQWLTVSAKLARTLSPRLIPVVVLQSASCMTFPVKMTFPYLLSVSKELDFFCLKSNKAS